MHIAFPVVRERQSTVKKRKEHTHLKQAQAPQDAWAVSSSTGLLRDVEKSPFPWAMELTQGTQRYGALTIRLSGNGGGPIHTHGHLLGALQHAFSIGVVFEDDGGTRLGHPQTNAIGNVGIV